VKTLWAVLGLGALAWLLWGRRSDGPPPEVQRAQRADAAGQGRLPYGTHAQLARDMAYGGAGKLPGMIRTEEQAAGAGALDEPLMGYGGPGRSGGSLS